MSYNNIKYNIYHNSKEDVDLKRLNDIIIFIFIFIFSITTFALSAENKVNEYNNLIMYAGRMSSEKAENYNYSRGGKIEVVGYTNMVKQDNAYMPGSQILYIVQPGDSLYLIAAEYNSSVQRIKEVNNLTINDISIGQKLFIPQSDKENITDDKTMTYIVQPGDSLNLIAKKNNTSIQTLRELNRLDNNQLVVGQKLLIPVPKNEENPGDGENDDSLKKYTVKVGDSLYLIALEFSTTVQEIKKINGLNDNNLTIGQSLLIPDDNGSNEPDGEDNQGDVYIVQQGDSLYLISQKFNISVDEIIEKNNLNNNILVVGQKLVIENSDENNTDDDINKPDVPLVYFVRSGDNLWVIANRFNTTVDQLMNNNQLSGNPLYVGQMLFITEVVSNFDSVKYTIQPGDSLSSISELFNVQAKTIKEYNDLNSDNLVVGDKLIIHLTDYSNKNYNMVLSYDVEPDDNIRLISNKFNLSKWEIKNYNNFIHDIFSYGDKLEIPFYVEDKFLRNSQIISDEEMELLARAVYSEARGEPFEGQVAVAAVVLNRVKSHYFPDDLEDVIFEPWQFTAVHDGQFWLEPNQVAYLAAEAALEGWDPSNGALYYYNPKTATDDWVFYRDVIVKIGDHYFAISV